MQGYEDVDTVDYSDRTEPVEVRGDSGSGDGESGEGDQVHGDIENILGGAGGDILRGTNEANTITGGAGEDTVEGLEGDDTIRVRDGESDTVRCGGTPAFPDIDTATADSLPRDPTPDNDCETVLRPPSVTITDGPVDGGTIADTSPVFEFVSNIEGGGTECRVDVGNYAPCASPYTVGDQLSDGVHTVSISAINPSTQIPGEPATRTFTVDATAPSLSVTSPSGVNESIALTVVFEATDGGGAIRTTCAIDFTTPTTCASGAVLADLASGLHTLTVRATDAAGNVSEQIVEFVVDPSAPDVSVVPDSQVGGASDILVAAQPATASMIEVSRDGSTFTIVDNSSWLKADANCVQVDLHRVTCAPADVAALTVDAGDGNDAIVVNSGLNVQTEVSGGAGDDSLVSFGGATLRGDAGDDKIVGSWNADTVTGGAGHDTIRTLEGFDTIDVRDGEADDVRCGGDSGSVTADTDDTIGVDCGTVARTPTVTFTAGPVDGATTGDSTPTFGFVSDDVSATFQCSVDGASYSPCEDGYTTGELADGPHTIAVAATGINGTGVATTTFSIDTGGPFGVVRVTNGSDLSVVLTSDVVNDVSVGRAHGQYTVINSTGGLGSGGGCVQRDHHTVVCDDNGIAAVGVTTGDLGDTVSLNTRITVPATITGGIGADALAGGSGVDIIVGGAGNDSIDGGAGGDNLDGGAGDDDIVSADGEQDSVACSDGTDSALADAFDADDACEGVTRRSVVANWTSPGLPSISYFVYGAVPGERNELDVTANSRKALFHDSTSLIYAGSGCTQVDSNTVACDGRDVTGAAAFLGDDDDRLDIHAAAAMAVVVRGDDGSDLIRSRNGLGSLSGGFGDDTLVGGVANDELFGDEGNDSVDGGAGDDSLDGGDGVDTADYSARTTDLKLTLGGVSNDNGAANEHDQISSNVENVRGGAANDTITGSADANDIDGGGGSDVVDSAEGDDAIHARDGKADQLACGVGVDAVATDKLDTSSDCETSDLSAITTITAGPTDGGYVADSTPSFAFEADDVLATFQCRIDAEPFAPCGSPFTVAELTEGTHSFSVQALTPSLEPEGGPAISTFTVDTQAPDIAIVGGPTEGDTTGDSSPAIEFASIDATASFTCAIDRDEPVACSSPFTLQNLTEDDDHTVVVRATDPAGNASAPATRSFAVSSQALVSITAGPADSAHVQEPVAMFEFESEASTMFQCAVDGGEFAPCSSPYTLESPYGGARTFAVRALNAFGAPGPAERVPLFFEQGLPVDDTTKPKTYLDSGPRDGAISQYVPTFDFSANEEAAFLCRVDDEDWQGCESPWAPADLSIGWHRVEIGAQDAAGNFTDRIVSREFAYDPDHHPAAVDEVVDTLETEFPEVLAPSLELTVGDQEITPALTTQPDDGGDFVSRDTVVESTIASDPDSGFSIDTSDGPLSFAPADLASTASAPAVVAGNATVVADAGPSAAFVTRPAPLGTDVAVLLENQAFPASVSWQLDLAPDHELVMLTDGSVAVRLPTPDEEDATEDDNEEDPTAPGMPSGPGQSAYEAQVAKIDAAQAQTDDSTVAVIVAPVATDSQGNPVSTSLSIDNDTGSVTLHVGQPATAGDNVSVRTSVLSNRVASASKARQARHVYYGMGGGPSEMFTAPLDPKTSTPAFDNVMSRLRKFTGVRSGSKVRYFNGRIFRMLVPWDAALHNGQCQAEPGNGNTGAPPLVEDAVDGANPYTLGTRCYDLWLALRKVKNAADWSASHGNANYDLYVSPDQVYTDAPWNGADCAGIGGPRVHSPCALADYEAAFDALYTTLQSYAKSRPNQRRIRFWSGLNEPDITARKYSYGRDPPVRKSVFALRTYPGRITQPGAELLIDRS